MMRIRDRELRMVMYSLASNKLAKEQTHPELILDTVAKALYLLVDDITSKSKEQTLIDARYIAADLIYNNCDISLKEVGKLLGGRDHATIINGLKQTKILMGNNKYFAAKMFNAQRKLEGLI